LKFSQRAPCGCRAVRRAVIGRGSDEKTKIVGETLVAGANVSAITPSNVANDLAVASLVARRSIEQDDRLRRLGAQTD
jgi:hypothetical protein